MNKLFLVFAVLTLSTSLAGAADLGLRKGPPLYAPPAPPPMWNGFYLGLNAGGIWTNGHNQFITAAPAGVELGFPHNPLVGNPSIDTANFLAAFSSAASASGFNSGSNTGFIGGGQLGYNFQFQGRLIAGFEADFQGIAAGSPNHTIATVAPVAVDVNGRSTNYVGVHSVHGALDYLGTVRGRLGFLVTPSLLLYGTGGLAYGGAHLQTTSLVYNDFYAFQPSINTPGATHIPAATGGVNNNGAKAGWTAGGGLEWMFWPNWSAKVEYLYYDLGTLRQNFVLVQTDTETSLRAFFGGQARERVNGNMVRAGLNYHMNWGASAPVAPRPYGY